jgi:hypothetical protein
MSRLDVRGVSLDTADRDAAQAFELAISSFATHRKDLARHLDRPLCCDPDLILAHVLRGFSALLMARHGHDARAMLARWSREEAGTGHLLGCHAFALCECGRLFEARRAALDALRLAPRDSWAAHALAHVLEMSGQADNGLAWIDAYAPDSVKDGLAQHLAWHRALFLIDLGRVRDALDIFDHSVWRTAASRSGSDGKASSRHARRCCARAGSASRASMRGSRQNWESLGGSQAQRDHFTRIAVYAAISAERRPLAQGLLAERCLRFRGERWLTAYMERLVHAPDRSALPAVGFL